MSSFNILGPPKPDTIWKFALPWDDSFTLDMPLGSVPLSVGVQNGAPVLWAAVCSHARQGRHRFFLRGTGHPLGEARPDRFIGTFQLAERYVVFHLFDGGQEEFQT